MPWEKQFDVDAALERAGETFWAHGYEATSIRDLLNAMGIQKGSFYDTYGSKQNTYLLALGQYLETRIAEFQKDSEKQTPRQSLETHLNYILDECAAPAGRRGCMVVNGALEFGQSDPAVQKVVRRAFRSHRKFLFDCIVAGQEEGDVSSDIDAAPTADAMFAIVMAMRVHARAGTPKSTLRTLAHQALALIE